MEYILAFFAALLPQKPVIKESLIGAIVRLHDANTGRFFCSGTVISDKYVLTAAHCATAFMFIDVRGADGKSVAAYAFPVGINPKSDVALISGEFNKFEHIELVTSPAEIINGFKFTHAETCGYPNGGALFCNKLSNAEMFNFQFIADAFLYSGMSGGPVLSNGKVIGVNSAVWGNKSLFGPTIELLQDLDLNEQ